MKLETKRKKMLQKLIDKFNNLQDIYLEKANNPDILQEEKEAHMILLKQAFQNVQEFLDRPNEPTQ